MAQMYIFIRGSNTPYTAAKDQGGYSGINVTGGGGGGGSDGDKYFAPKKIQDWKC